MYENEMSDLFSRFTIVPTAHAQSCEASKLLDLLTDFMVLTIDPDTGEMNGVMVAGTHVADNRFRIVVEAAMGHCDEMKEAS